MSGRIFRPGVLALLLCVATLLSCREPFRPPYVIGFAESHSWVDDGIKAVVYHDGVGFAARLAFSGAEDSTFRPEVSRIQLTPQELEALAGLFRRNAFFAFPPRMHAGVTDGSSVEFCFAERNRHHEVYNYMVPDPAVEALADSLRGLFERKISVGESVPVEVLLEGGRERLVQYDSASAAHACTRFIIDLLARRSLASGYVGLEEVRDLLIEPE